jgi:hypothetical protein
VPGEVVEGELAVHGRHLVEAVDPLVLGLLGRAPWWMLERKRPRGQGPAHQEAIRGSVARRPLRMQFWRELLDAIAVHAAPWCATFMGRRGQLPTLTAPCWIHSRSSRASSRHGLPAPSRPASGTLPHDKCGWRTNATALDLIHCWLSTLREA